MNHAPRLRVLKHRLLTTLFAAAISLPLLDWAFRFDQTPELTENRTSAAAPAWPRDAAAWRALPTAFTAYWNDAFGMRKLLVRTHARALLWLEDSPNPMIVVGRQNTLFFAGEQAVDQFRGLRPLPGAVLSAWANALSQRKNWLEARGIRFVFVVAPSKESVYPELYPSRVDRVGPTTLDGLLAYLRAHTDVTLLDLRPALLAATGSEALYFKTDTHWNDRGAYFAYQALLAQLQKWFPELPMRPLASFRAQQAPRYCGDLSAFLGLAQELAEPRTELVPTPALAAMPVEPAQKLADGSRREIYETPERSRRALVFHDSFLLPPEERGTVRRDACFVTKSELKLSQLLADSFAHTAFNWQFGSGFVAELVERERPDVVVLEVAERLLVYGPQGEVPR